MSIATPERYVAMVEIHGLHGLLESNRCVHCGAPVTFHHFSPTDIAGTWVHEYDPQWGPTVICDPQRAREAAHRV